MLSTLVISLVTTISSFFHYYDEEAGNAVCFFNCHPEIDSVLTIYLNRENVVRAKSIVAPEVSFFSNIEDILQYKTAFLFYIQSGLADFSIGRFQMKPSFAERIENIVQQHKYATKYKILVISSQDIKEQRKIRLDRLLDIKWQCVYLSAFIDVVGDRTFGKFASGDYELKYWATIYNSGIDSSHKRILQCMKLKQFPRSNRFNYSDVVLEFYNLLKAV